MDDEARARQLTDEAWPLVNDARFDDARAKLAQAITAAPTNAEAHRLLGLVEVESGNRDAALRAFARAEALSPQNAEIYATRALAHRAWSDWTAALDDWRAYEERSGPDERSRRYRSYAWHALGIQRVKNRDLTGGEVALREALEAVPAHAATRAVLGLVLQRLGRVDEAFDEFSASLALDPRCEAAYFNRAVLQGKLGEHRAAAADYIRYLALVPGDEEAKRLLAMQIACLASTTSSA